MDNLIIPIFFWAALMGLILGFSYICVETVLRLIGRGLGAQAASEPVYRRRA